MIPFEEANAETGWSPYASLPTVEQGNRINACGTYLVMEQESPGK